jgi:hypothetical protein
MCLELSTRTPGFEVEVWEEKGMREIGEKRRRRKRR